MVCAKAYHQTADDKTIELVECCLKKKISITPMKPMQYYLKKTNRRLNILFINTVYMYIYIHIIAQNKEFVTNHFCSMM